MIGNSLFVGKNIEWTALDAEKDAAELSRWTRDPQFSRTLFEKPARTYAIFEVKKKVKEDLKSADEKRNAFIYAIRKKGTADLLCLLRFGWVRSSHQSARLFMDFSSPAIMVEYGQEVMAMALRFAFMELSLHRLWAVIPANYIDQIKLFESSGYLREIQQREAYFCDGKYHDLLVYAILKPEWKKVQQEEAAKMQSLEVAA